MDKKTKKRIAVLRKRLQKLQQQLAGAKQQNDEPEHLIELESEITDVRLELDRLAP